MQLSVIIPAHNPRPEFLRETLAALAAQTLPKSDWELLLVDNASEEPLAARFDLAWHPQGRHLREDDLGLTPARLCGIRQSRGDVLVFVDDDNVLAPDYLHQARDLALSAPQIGACSGSITGRYETPPPDWVKAYLGMLAIREIPRDRWSNRYDDGEAHPCGAGLVVRRNVAAAYAEKLRTDEQRRGMDRKGKQLISCGDLDLAFTAIDLGLGIGNFQRLRLTHLIPAGRLEEKYLVNLAESMAFSTVLLNNLRQMPLQRGKARRAYEFARLLFLDARARRFEFARRRGAAQAREFLHRPRP